MDNLKIRTIVVEDHTEMRKCLCDHLSKACSCEIVATAENGEEAIEIFKNVQVDLVILDLNLTGKYGFTVLKACKQETAAKVLVFTMHSEIEVAKAALAAGADGFMLKGLGISVLDNAILEVVEGRKPVYIN